MSSRTAVRTFYDTGSRDRPCISVIYPDGRRYVVDVIESLKNDPQNIDHPLIREAQRRYIAAISYDSQKAGQAENYVKAISRALVAGAKSSATRIKLTIRP
jgi:hypothetical protein